MPRYLMMIRINENERPAEGPGPELMERIGKLLDEMTQAGVLLETAGLKPTAEATRVTLSRGKLSVTDGPFTETKEVVGGYAMLQGKNKADVLEWTKRFLELHGDQWKLISEVREIVEG